MTSERCLALLFGWCSSIVWLGVIKWLRGGKSGKAKNKFNPCSGTVHCPAREREREECVCLYLGCLMLLLTLTWSFIDIHWLLSTFQFALHCVSSLSQVFGFLTNKKCSTYYIFTVHYLLLIMRYDYLWPVKTHNDMACRKSYMIDLAFPRI